MIYKLYKDGNNDFCNIIPEVLHNRGISDVNTYLNLTEEVIIPSNYLSNMTEAIGCFKQHYDKNNKIMVLVDEDVDGFCSASMMYSYVKKLNPDYPIKYILHKKPKSHGLQDIIGDKENFDINNSVFDDDVKLLIIPDASTNDVEECKVLKENGIDIIILDHHQREVENPYAIIVNNQISEKYSNKDFSGAGIVFKFLLELDDEFWVEYSYDFLDLCALANISDVMDIRTYETKYFIEKGLSHIHNKCFLAYIEAQEYSMNNVINIHNVQWYVTPLMNALIRLGGYEDKELLFKAFLEQDEYFEYNKRAWGKRPAETITESIYARVARLSTNIKSQQDRMRDKSVKQIINVIQENNNNKIVYADVTKLLDNSLTGMVAIKIAEYFNKPCLLLNEHTEKEYFIDENGIKNEKIKIMYGGSARNLKHSPIDSFKDVINNTKSFNWGRGHNQAFGVSIDKDKLQDGINEINECLKEVKYDSTYYVDFILSSEDIETESVFKLLQLKNIIGQGIEEPLIAIENIQLTREDCAIIGKNEDVITFEINGVKCINFKCKNGNALYDWLNDEWGEKGETIDITIVAKASENNYNGVCTCQLIIEDINKNN